MTRKLFMNTRLELPIVTERKQTGFDAALAHGLARLALGLNIAIHGYSRLPHLVEFADLMVKQFAGTFLPSALVYITGLGITIGEAGIGTKIAVFATFKVDKDIEVGKDRAVTVV
jgi:hypothetical protein